MVWSERGNKLNLSLKICRIVMEALLSFKRLPTSKAVSKATPTKWVFKKSNRPKCSTRLMAAL